MYALAYGGILKLLEVQPLEASNSLQACHVLITPVAGVTCVGSGPPDLNVEKHRASESSAQVERLALLP